MKVETNSAKLKDQIGGVLTNLLGRKVDAIWLASDSKSSLVHPSTPVVFLFQGIQLELWSIYLSEFSVSVNTLDLEKPPFYWSENGVVGYEWVCNEFEIFTEVVGSTIVSVELLERKGFCQGIKLEFEKCSLTVCNDCDNIVLKYQCGKRFIETEI